MKLGGRVAVVTGAGGGIGRGIALALSRRNCQLALVDKNAEGLGETAGMIRDVRVSLHPLDVTDRAACAALPGAVAAEHGRVDFLVNNAGVAIGGTFEQVGEADFDWLMDVNFHAVVRLTRLFLPHLMRSDAARIVNLSSLFGLIAPPGQSAYAAAKFAVRGFSESLRHELEDARSSVGVTVVHPGGIATDIARNARPPRHLTDEEAARMAGDRDRFQKFLRMSPAKAGEIIVRGIERERPRILVGSDARLGALIERLSPVGYWNVPEAEHGMKKWAIAGVSLVGGLLGAGFFSARVAKQAEALVPMDGRLVDVGGGARLHVTEQGEGSPLLLIHGLGAQLRSFAQSLVDELAREHRVIRVDRPGSGYSPILPGGSQRLVDQADAMAGLIDALALDRPWIVGHSLGGALALQIAERHPGKVRGLALIAPATQPVRDVPEVFRGLMVPLPVAGLVARTIAVPLGLATRDKVLAAVFAPEAAPADYVTAGGGALALRPGNVAAACADLQLARADAEAMVARYPALDLPVAILFGRGDQLLAPAEHGEKTASEIRGATLSLVEGGHMLPFTRPVETARWVRSVIETR